MIRYLKHKEIDKHRWDVCIRHALNRRVYAFSWYLDIVSPGWDALATEDYSVVFPLTHRTKLGVSYLFQPFFAQQLGVFSPAVIGPDQVEAFLSAIPDHFRFVEIHLNAMNVVEGGAGLSTMRVNHELSLATSYEAIYNHYNQNCRRNLKKAREHALGVVRAVDPDLLISLFAENYGRSEGKLRERDYRRIRRLIGYALEHDLGRINGVLDGQGDLMSAAFFLKEHDRYYFLFAASAKDARENGAMFFLIDRFLYEHAGEDATLDFEGGNDAALGRFYKGFGSTESHYPMVTINRLPLLASVGFNLKQKLKGEVKWLFL